MTTLSAAEHILNKSGKPLSGREISRLAIDYGYWQTKERTAWATMNAQVYTDIASSS
ncbi:MAG: winged helix-turn-helix domain-containing protein [Terrimicrobiaceae bacterium]